MSDRIKKIMRLALGKVTEENGRGREENCPMTSETQTVASSTEVLASASQHELTKNQVQQKLFSNECR